MQDILIPDELERKKIFYWLQRVSSLTAWQRILTYYQKWADSFEKSLTAGEALTGTALEDFRKNFSFSSDKLISILKGLSNCEKAVERLSQGDKRVFQFNAHGFLALADRPLSYWCDHSIKALDFEIYFDANSIPFWSETDKARQELSAAWSECANVILEDRFFDSPAPISYAPPMQINLGMVFPNPLPELPAPQREILIKTGQNIPHSGIWEPVHVDIKQSLMGLVKTPLPPIDGIWRIAGCMNYLHGGSDAPQVEVNDGKDFDSIDVYWRLLWCDDRYESGTVPDLESNYVFQEPEHDSARRMREKIAESGNLNMAAPVTDLLVTRSGQAAQRAGRWAMLGDAKTTLSDIKKGDTLPQRNGNQVDWVWISP